MDRVYLDHNATAPLCAAAAAAMRQALEGCAGNPSSLHAEGRRARELVERARAHVAARLGVAREEVVFTSGGTEANVLALRGAAAAAVRRGRRPHLVVSAVEHPSVLETAAALAAEGARLTVLPVDGEGRVAPDALARALDEDVALVSIQLANSETGVLQPAAELAAAARARGAWFHADAVQAVGRVPLDPGGFDLFSVSAHKLGGPAGAGALVLRAGVGLGVVSGGHQERGRRAGTENVLGLVGFGAACAAPGPDAARLAVLRDRLERGLLALDGARVHGGGARLPNTVNVGFAGAPGDAVLQALDLAGVAVSTGAACSSGTLAPSPVLRALGLDDRAARRGVRFSLGPGNTEDQIDRVLELLPPLLRRIRAEGLER